VRDGALPDSSYHHGMADRGQLEHRHEGMGTQLAWVRDYL
jgi:hypothetical protein